MLPKSVQKLIKADIEDRPDAGSIARLAEETKSKMRKQGANEAQIEKAFESAETVLTRLEIEENTSFYEFYVNLRSPPFGRGDELLTPHQITDEKESLFHEDEYPGIYDRFLQLSSIEGEGSYFF